MTAPVCRSAQRQGGTRVLGLLLLLPLAQGQEYDLFLYDDFSLDPEAMGYQVIAPRPSIQSRLSQRLGGSNEEVVDELTSRLQSTIVHPLSETAAVNLDVEADFRWPTERDAFTDSGLAFTSTINRATVVYEGSRVHSEAGWLPLRWGPIPGASVLDVVSPANLNLTTDLAGEKHSQVTLQAAAVWGQQRLEFFLTPRPQLADLPPVVADAATAPLAEAWPAAGVRYLVQIARGEIGAYAAVLTPDQPGFADPETLADPSLEPYGLFGFSGTYRLGQLNLKGELAYKYNQVPTQDGARLTVLGDARDRVETAIGFDLSHPPTGEWSTYLTLGRWLDTSDLETEQRMSSHFALSWQRPYFDDRLLVSGAAYSSLTEPVLRTVGEISYQFQPEWTLNTRVSRITADEETGFDELDGLVQYLATVTYSF